MKSLIRMNHDVFARIKRYSSHCFRDQSHFKIQRKIPGYNFAGGDIFDDGKIRECISEWYVGDVCTENFERNGLIEFSLQLVGKYPVLHSLFHDCFVWVLSPHFGDQPILPHNSLYLLVIHPKKPHFNASPAIFAFAFVKDFLDFKIISVIFVWFKCMPQPFVISAPGNTCQFAENVHIIT